ncbi:hypothetical protein [Taibaiella chishuiensis]|uniref:Cleaved adhesin domain-containing protein n=1 Tax=Taibaiella chishuiensis TaxID=1434707 RepID=A0A2P8D1Z4_9BACT|nr:hypothetical protein [Taibaiella chishuiensis]PSK91229.1 hypothetical protein B0I18_106241 [Taibaiella chishuiensis]
MKHILLILCTLVTAISGYGQCPNGDLEMGTFVNWRRYINTAPSTGTLNPAAFTEVSVPDRHMITVAPGVDTIVGSEIPVVAAGKFAARLGNSRTGKQSEILSYTFTLTQNFSFMYALVFQNEHPTLPIANPYFTYWISVTNDLPTSTLSGNLLAMQEYRADSSPFFQHSGSIAYKQWTKECVMTKFPSLYARVGQTVTIYFATADCNANGHYGYAYIDELCKANTVTASFTMPTSIGNPESFPINADATASTNEAEYYYTAQECNAAGTTLYGSPVSTAIYPGTAGAENIRTLFLPGTFVHGKYYRITLYVRNCDGYWVSTWKVLYVN